MKALLFTVLAALTVVPAHAQKNDASAETIRWPVPWKAGLRLAYEFESLDTEVGKDKREKIRVTDNTVVSIASESEQGFVQEWKSNGGSYEVIEGDATKAEMMRAFMKALSNLALQVDLGKDGNYERIRNLDTVAARFRSAMTEMMLPAVEAEVRKGLGEKANEADVAAALEKARKRADDMLSRMSSPAVVEHMAAQLIKNYNGFVGVELENGASYTLDTELPNPLGGKSFPAKLEFGLYSSEDDPQDIYLEWTMKIDPERGLDALWDTVEALSGEKMDKKARKKLPKDLSIDDEGFLLFHRTSGVIEMYSNERRIVLGDLHKVERERLRLVDGEHSHEWSKPIGE